MVSDETFNLLVDYLYDRISPSVIKGYGIGDAQPKKDKEAELCDLFENHTYGSGDGYFLLSDSGVLHVYNNRFYEKVTTKTFLNEVIKTVLAKIEVGKVYSKFSNKTIAKECLSGMENKWTGRFLPDRRYITFNNGVFDVKEGVLKPFSKDLRTDMILDIDYDKYATYGLWDSKIAEIIPNAESRDAFQQFCGSLLVNRDEVRIEYVCFLIGPGSNGKSVIASSIASVFGNEYFTTYDPEQLLNDSQRMFNLSSLDGVIANFTDDMKPSDISSSSFKSFASGERFQARHPYGHKIFQVKAPPLLCCANSLPITSDDSWGCYRRILPIYSTTKTWDEKDKDPMLKMKLSTKEARMAIFNWIYEGYRKIMTNGGNVKLGQEVIDAQIAAREDSNSARRWIKERGLVKIEARDKNDSTWKSLQDWHRLYREYCLENGEKGVHIARSLAKIFNEKGFVSAKRNNGKWYCIGTLGLDTDDSGGSMGGFGDIKDKDGTSFFDDLPF